jgi:phosphatidylglycerol:prolipoprotein diacylglycerol transferase
MMATLGAWFHDLSPFIVRIGPSFGLRWYGAAYLAGFAVAYLLLVRLSKIGRSAVPTARVADAMMWLIGGVIVGGRLAYVAIYDPALATQFSNQFPFWGVFAINRGGMASHGGILGVVLAAWRISCGWKTGSGAAVGRCSVWHVFDLVALISPAGLFFGRLANFINGELLGKIHSMPGKAGPWWTVQFPSELIERPVDLTVEQNAQLTELMKTAAPGLPPGAALPRLVERAGEFEEQLRPLLSSRHPSQLYQAFAEGIVLAAVLWLIWWWKPKRDGLIGAAFLITYGVLRVVTEFWRLPDAQFGEHGRIYGLSRGQWLSVGMVLAGTIMAGYLLRRRRGSEQPM